MTCKDWVMDILASCLCCCFPDSKPGTPDPYRGISYSALPSDEFDPEREDLNDDMGRFTIDDAGLNFLHTPHSFHLILSLSFFVPCPSVWLPLFLSFSVSLSVRLSVCLSLYLSLCFYLFLTASFGLSLSLCLSMSASLSLSLSLSISLCVGVCVSVCLSVCLSLYFYLFLAASFRLSFSLSVSVSVYPCVPRSKQNTDYVLFILEL